jgi:hypothetical protein
MHKSLLAVPLALMLASCSSFTWKGQRTGVTRDQSGRGIVSVEELRRGYESERFWSSVKARGDGRINALGRDLGRVLDTIDRHVFNYSTTDPAVNHPTDLSVVDQFGRFGLSTVWWF